MSGRVSGPRARALFRLLDIPIRLPALNERGGRLARAVAPPHHGPLPASLGRRIERLVELRHRAGRWSLNSGELFVLPSWLRAAFSPSKRKPASALRVHVDASRAPRVTVIGNAIHDALASLTLSPRRPAAWRRSLIADTAAVIRRDLEQVLGAPPAASDWLEEMENAWEAAEQTGIAVWNEFLAAVDVPLGLRIPDFELSLADLLVVLDGPNGGRNREWFANHWPAAAATTLRADNAREVLRRIDANRAAAVKIATAAFCCQEQEDCEPARPLARQMPKYRADARLARVLAGHGPRTEVHIRAILTWANQKEHGAVLRRLARCSDHAREQMELAAATAVQPVFLSGGCRMAVGQMLARTFAGSGFDPARLNPERIAAVFVAVSAECLAAFVTKRPDPTANKLETGVTVFADFLAEAPWRLSPRQFARFIAGAARHTANLEDSTGRFGDRWPAPAAWSQDDTPFDGAAIAPLLSKNAVREEGEAMGNCLARGNLFERQALVGRLALFSIQVGDARATLGIRPLERRGAIRSYGIAQLTGPKNSSPPPACETVARSLVERLNSRLPLPVPAVVGRMRKTMRQLENQRRGNRDKDVANDRWRRYVRFLPKRFQPLTPREIVGGAIRS